MLIYSNPFVILFGVFFFDGRPCDFMRNFFAGFLSAAFSGLLYVPRNY